MSATPPPAVSWQSPEPQEGPAPGVEFAPHGGRLVAYIIDGIIIGIVVTLICLVGAGVLYSGATMEGNRLVSVTTPAAVISAVIFVIAGVIGLLVLPVLLAAKRPDAGDAAVRPVRRA